MTTDYESKKSAYDTQAMSLESGFARLEQDVKQLRNVYNSAETQQFRLETERKIIEAQLERAEKELASLQTNDGSRQKTFR